jgi:anti-sigma-K factor RskA
VSDYDPHISIGAYVLDALDDNERRLFEAHLAECDSCRQEIGGLSATAALLGTAVATTAPPGLRQRVMSEVARTRQLSPVVELAQRAPGRTWYRQPLGIAAALLLVVSVALGSLAISENRRADRAENLANRITAVTTDPARQEAQQPVASGGTGTLISVGGRAVFSATGVRALPAGRTYQLWVIDSSGARSVGVLGRGEGGRLTQFVSGVTPRDTIGMTVEPKGGSTAPTSDPIVAIPVRTA